MATEWTITLASDKGINFELMIALAEEFNKYGIETYDFDKDSFAIREAQRLLREKGPTYILSIVELREAVLPKVPIGDQPLVAKIIGTQLAKLNPQRSLVIIDPYFFAEKSDIQNYLLILHSVFAEIVPTLQTLVFVTNGHHNETLIRHVKTQFREINTNIHIEIRISREFHDRFWIVDEMRGIFVGTSLNGIGKKYALVDYMNEEDVGEIVSKLKADNII